DHGAGAASLLFFERVRCDIGPLFFRREGWLIRRLPEGGALPVDASGSGDADVFGVARVDEVLLARVGATRRAVVIANGVAAQQRASGAEVEADAALEI